MGLLNLKNSPLSTEWCQTKYFCSDASEETKWCMHIVYDSTQSHNQYFWGPLLTQCIPPEPSKLHVQKQLSLFWIIFPSRVFCALRGRSIKLVTVYSFFLKLVLMSSPLIEKCKKNSQISPVRLITHLSLLTVISPSLSLSFCVSLHLSSPSSRSNAETIINYPYPSLLSFPQSSSIFPGPIH